MHTYILVRIKTSLPFNNVWETESLPQIVNTTMLNPVLEEPLILCVAVSVTNLGIDEKHQNIEDNSSE